MVRQKLFQTITATITRICTNLGFPAPDIKKSLRRVRKNNTAFFTGLQKGNSDISVVY